MADNPQAFPAVPGFDAALLARFVSRIDGGDWSVSECWNWTGAKNKKGYGVFSLSKREQARAHRFSLYAYTGRQPGLMVLHKCDNPSCVNPLHLEEGTHGDNMRQMAERRRAAREERHAKAILTFEEAVAITVLSASDAYTDAELAKMFGVHKAAIGAVTTGRNWPDAYAQAAAMLNERHSHEG